MLYEVITHHHGGMGHMHDPEQMRHRFVVSLIATLPILLFSPTLQQWFGFSFDFPFRGTATFLLARNNFV